jgi:CBS domain-containing protein
MNVKDVMTGTPYYCGLGTNLGSAVELMWNGNCGFLPVVDPEGRVAGVITDRDICIALATRGKPAGEIAVEEVITRSLFSCKPEEDVHTALKTMRDARVRRLPVIARDRGLVGIVSMDDLVMHAEPRNGAKEPELSCDEVVKTYQAVMQRRAPALYRGGAVA